MLIDAVVLAGGRSSRLGSVPKATLLYEHHTLLERTLAATGFARHTVVVGDVTLPTHRGQILLTREDPPYGGPAAGIAAGVTTLAAADPAQSDYTAVLACDMPRVEAATSRLVESLPGEAHSDGVLACDDEHRLQPLVAIYKTATLVSALAAQRRSGGLDGQSVFRLIAPLNLTPILVPERSTDDVDTWMDAEKFGIKMPGTQGNNEGEIMTDRDEENKILTTWSGRLADALQILDLEVEQKVILGLAGSAAHSVIRPAGPVTTFLVGYAAGTAAAGGKISADAAVRSAADVAFQLCRDAGNESPADDGWRSTGQ